MAISSIETGQPASFADASSKEIASGQAVATGWDSKMLPRNAADPAEKMGNRFNQSGEKIMDQPTPSSPQDANQIPRFREAYEKLLDEIRQVPDSTLIPINIDIPTAVTTALGVLPEIRALRPQIAAEMPAFDLARFDKLEMYTLAVGHAHAVYLAASTPAESLDVLTQNAAALRETLFSDASALAQRRLIDPQRLKELKGQKGYRNLAFDLMTLAALLRESWPEISGKTALQLAELDQAETFADRILTAVGYREQASPVVAETAENRQRAFALFVGAYDHARRAVGFLRWNQGDADEIAPSLYAGRNTAHRKAGDAQSPPAGNPQSSGAPSASTSPGALVPASHGTSAGAPVMPVASAAPVGLPESEPFVAR